MKLLKKENWWIWLILAFFSGGSSVLVLAALLDIYDKDAWYGRILHKTPKWCLIVLGVVFGVASLASTAIMSVMDEATLENASEVLVTALSFGSLMYLTVALIVAIFQIQIVAMVNGKLGTPGREIYLSPYIWILGLIIPIIGWIVLIVMLFYLQIWYLVMLYRGAGEKFEKEL